MKIKQEIKEDQNTKLEDIDILKNPTTETLPFRYVLASHWCKDKHVLDAAMGQGYGSYILKGLGAKTLTGFDIDKNAVQLMPENDICAYEIDLTVPYIKKTLKDNFDTVVSIETFEHLPKDKIEIYLANLKQWCRDGGTIFITTPRRMVDNWRYAGGTHLYEYSIKEFVTILDKNFKGSDIKFIGIKEVQMGLYHQLVSVLEPNLADSRIMCGIISLKK